MQVDNRLEAQNWGMEVPCSPRCLTEPDVCAEKRVKFATGRLVSLEYGSREAEGDKWCRVT